MYLEYIAAPPAEIVKTDAPAATASRAVYTRDRYTRTGSDIASSGLL